MTHPDTPAAPSLFLSEPKPYEQQAPLVLGPDAQLRCEDIERTATSDRPAIAWSERAILGMTRSHDALGRAAEAGVPVYGLTTGFGPFVRFAADGDGRRQGLGLVHHLGAGWGEDAPAEIVRSTMIIRAQTLAQGCSGVSPAAADAFMNMIRAGIVPCVPEIGSVGASGDLVPLAHCVRALVGESLVYLGGRRMPATDALRRCGLEPTALDARDALSIVNGTAFMTAHLALAVSRSERLLMHAERLSGWLCRALGARRSALDPRLHAARGHTGQTISASLIRAEAEAFGLYEDGSRPLQEVYAVRCAAQILGACRENLAHARRLCEAELAGVSDNPIIDPDASPDEAVMHGGNFQGQQIAFAADALNAALVQAAVLADRQVAVLADPDLTGAPLLLAWEPGATSGIAGAQLTATSLVAEMRHHQGPAATASIPTNGRNQDIVSMGTMAARQALGQTERLAGVLAILVIALDQLAHLRTQGRAEGLPTPRSVGLPGFAPFTVDRPLRDDIERIGSALLAAE